MKFCKKCGTEKPRIEFSNDKGKKGGLFSFCKECANSYYRDNKQVMLDGSRKYKEINKHRIADHYRGWKKENKDKIASYARQRRSKARNAEGRHTETDVKAIFDSQRGKCANCTKKLFKSGAKKYHVDHVVPLAKGGSNWPSNLQCLCPSCNGRKSDKTPEDWARENGRLL